MLKSNPLIMQQASRFIASLRNLRDSCDAGDIVCAAWKRAVGEKIAGRARASKLVRDTLVVEVEDWLWQRNLMGLEPADSEEESGKSRRAGHRGRPRISASCRRAVDPQLAATSTQEFSLVDEADRIRDPGLRRIYRNQRRKEIA